MATLFNVERFKAELNNGGARPNQFSVQLTFPLYVQGAALAGNKSQFLVTAAELPGQTIGVAPVFYRGREIKMAGDRTFAPFTCTVLNDGSFAIRTALEQWMNGMENVLTKTGFTVPIAYQSDIEITQLDRNGGTLKKYLLRECFPSDIGAVGLDFGLNDQISSFQVAFQYQSFLIVR